MRGVSGWRWTGMAVTPDRTGRGDATRRMGETKVRASRGPALFAMSTSAPPSVQFLQEGARPSPANGYLSG